MRSFGIDEAKGALCITICNSLESHSSPAYRGGGLLAFVFDKAKEAEVLLPFDYLNPHRLRIVFCFVQTCIEFLRKAIFEFAEREGCDVEAKTEVVGFDDLGLGFFNVVFKF